MTTASITLEAKTRDTAKSAAKDLRREKRVPAILYGHDVKNQSVSCAYQELHNVFVKAGESTIIELKTNGKSVPVLIHQIDFDPVTEKYIHVDFYAPDMKKEVTANIPIRSEGESPGVKDEGGILIRHRETITVKCLPKDLPHDIEIDLSILKNISDSLTIEKVKVPAAVTIMDDPETLLFVVEPPRKEEELAPEPAAGEAVAEGEIAEGEEGADAEKEEGKDGDDKGASSAKATGARDAAKKEDTKKK